MAHRSSRDQPPAYTSQDHDASTTGGSRARHSAAIPNHSTKASMHLQAGAYGSQLTMPPRYLELTFSVMVKCHGSFEAVVVAIDEDYDTLLDDLAFHFGRNARGKKSPALMMRIAWEDGWKDSWSSIGSDIYKREWHSTLTPGNLIAMLRLLKSKGGMNYIKVEEE